VPACPNQALALIAETVTIDPGRCHLTGACVEACLPGALDLVGRRWTTEEVLDALERDRIYFDESGGGATISGGDPFAQPDFLEALLLGCGEREIPVVVDTCGHVAPETFRRVIPLAQGVLFDLKLMDPGAHERFTGVDNRWILENLSWVANGCRPEGGDSPGGSPDPSQGRGSGEHQRRSCPRLTVRLPLIPGINDEEENLRATAHFLLGLKHTPPVDLLPYHRLGVDKYRRMGRQYHLWKVASPDQNRVQGVVRILRDAGLEVTVRGEAHDHD